MWSILGIKGPYGGLCGRGTFAPTVCGRLYKPDATIKFHYTKLRLGFGFGFGFGLALGFGLGLEYRDIICMLP